MMVNVGFFHYLVRHVTGFDFAVHSNFPSGFTPDIMVSFAMMMKSKTILAQDFPHLLLVFRHSDVYLGNAFRLKGDSDVRYVQQIGNRVFYTLHKRIKRAAF
jgi:hypothetical protein